jgi:hypothetical protein
MGSPEPGSSGARAGWLLVAAGAAFWLGWLLMPGVGVTDAARIFELVGASRDRVFASSVLHLATAAFLALAVPALVRLRPARGSVALSLAPALLALGACAIAADAVIHLVAYEMTAPGVDRSAMLPVMERLQSFDLALLAPLILALFLGMGALAGGASRAGWVSRWNPRLHGIAVAVLVVGGPLLGPRGGGRIVGLTVLALVSASTAWVGLGLARRSAP